MFQFVSKVVVHNLVFWCVSYLFSVSFIDFIKFIFRFNIAFFPHAWYIFCSCSFFIVSVCLDKEERKRFCDIGRITYRSWPIDFIQYYAISFEIVNNMCWFFLLHQPYLQLLSFSPSFQQLLSVGWLGNVWCQHHLPPHCFRLSEGDVQSFG